MGRRTIRSPDVHVYDPVHEVEAHKANCGRKWTINFDDGDTEGQVMQHRYTGSLRDSSTIPGKMTREYLSTSLGLMPSSLFGLALDFLKKLRSGMGLMRAPPIATDRLSFG